MVAPSAGRCARDVYIPTVKTAAPRRAAQRHYVGGAEGACAPQTVLSGSRLALTKYGPRASSAGTSVRLRRSGGRGLISTSADSAARAHSSIGDSSGRNPLIAQLHQGPYDLQLVTIPWTEHQKSILHWVWDAPSSVYHLLHHRARDREVEAAVVMRMQVRELASPLKSFGRS